MPNWTERSLADNKGVDHLGMRVAGESCYSALIDFTTTVSWRPRYFPFYCWATKQAFARAGGDLDDENPRPVDRALYRRTFKRLDFAMAAATLAANSGASRIVGSKKLGARIRRLSEPVSVLALDADHVKSRMGGFSVYAGPLRHLGLVSSAQGVDVPTRGSPGDALAEAFGRSYAAAGVDVLAKDSLSRAELERLAEYCGLDQFAARASRHEAVAQELALTREHLFGFGRFRDNQAIRRRIRTLGVILELHRLADGSEVSLQHFRAATLLGRVEFDASSPVAFELSRGYEGVLAHWKIYQVHAYATLALESLLSVVLSLAKIADTHGSGVELEALMASCVDRIEAGVNRSGLTLAPALHKWTHAPLREVADYLGARLEAPESLGTLSEPSLRSAIWRGYHDDLDAWAHASALLLLLSCVHARQLGASDWLGHDDATRLPPQALIRDLEQALAEGLDGRAFFARIVRDRVIRQHRRNALRKLVDQPTVDSQKFVLEGSRLIVVSPLVPGTSNPRFYNTVEFLSELGYLDPSKGLRLTAEGLDLLAWLRERDQS